MSNPFTIQPTGARAIIWRESRDEDPAEPEWFGELTGTHISFNASASLMDNYEGSGKYGEPYVRGYLYVYLAQSSREWSAIGWASIPVKDPTNKEEVEAARQIAMEKMKERAAWLYREMLK